MNMLTWRERGGDLNTALSRMDRLFDERMRSLPLRRPFKPCGPDPSSSFPLNQRRTATERAAAGE